MKLNILKYLLVAISLICFLQRNIAQTNQVQDSLSVTTHRLIKIDTLGLSKTKKIPLLSGMSIMGDLLGGGLVFLTQKGSLEGAFRLHIKETYFPTIEAGVGRCYETNEITTLQYKTSAPFFRIGVDYNFARNKSTGNRILGGFRYGFSHFNFDLSSEDLVDPLKSTSYRIAYKKLSSTVQWLDLVAGIEAKIWKNLHLGWTIRFRKRLYQKESTVGQAYYVPGFGKNDEQIFGGSFNVIFNL